MIVEWHDRALDRLADIYVAISASERDGVIRCVEQTTSRLALDPSSVGESRGRRRRVWFNRPLMVVYDLLDGGGVLIVHVSLVKPSSNDD